MKEKISKIWGKVSASITRKMNSTGPERMRYYLNLFLLAEVILLIGMGLYRHSLGKLFSDAFKATAVGGLYSFAAPVFMNLDNPLAGLMEAKLTSDDFVIWACSGFGYIALTRYNALTEKLGYSRSMQFIHSIFLCLFLGGVGTPIAILIAGLLILPAESLWAAGPIVLKAIALVLGGAGMAFFVTLLVTSVKSLISQIKDFVKLYLFILVFLAVLLVVVLLLEKLVSFMEQSAVLSPLLAGIEAILRFVGITENSIINLIQTPVFVKGAIGAAIFLMYNITAVRHDRGVVI